MQYKNKPIHNFLTLLLFLIISQSCSKKFQKGTIYFGSGGGFAGSFREYQLNANGDLFFQQSGVDSLIFIKTLDSLATRKLFKKYYKLNLDSEDLDAPGNIYYYVGRREGKFRNHKITFGNPEAGVTSNIKDYYDEFNKIISETKPIK